MKTALLDKNIIRMYNLRSLLACVDALFSTAVTKKGEADQYNYTLGKFPRGWSFRVVNNWNEWSKQNIKFEFGLYDEPEEAVIAFLDYCIDNKIEPGKLIQ